MIGTYIPDDLILVHKLLLCAGEEEDGSGW